MERLDKFIAAQCNMSRKQAQQAIRDGRVSVDKATVRTTDFKLSPQECEVALDGEGLIYKEFIYIMMNKPAGVLSASTDKRTMTVIDLLPPQLKRRGLFPAGRLDKDTTGLLIITDDGQLAHNMLSPRRHIYKTYRACLSGSISGDDVRAFKDGIRLSDGGECMPARLWHGEGEEENTAYVKICEGKFHQVKRMFLSRGLEVISLERKSIGQLKLDESLSEGQARELNFCEISLIFE